MGQARQQERSTREERSLLLSGQDDREGWRLDLLGPGEPHQEYSEALQIQRRSACICCTAITVLALSLTVVGIALVVTFFYARPFYTAKPYPWPYAFVQPSNALQPHNTFFVLGDWGRQGSQQQLQVADLMNKLAEDTEGGRQPAFIISTGDNFYDLGLRSYDDPLFKASFTDVYNATGLQVPWYAVLGNHDYPNFYYTSIRHPTLFDTRYSVHWQDTSINPDQNLATKDWRWNCKQGVWRQSFGTLLDIVYLDSMPQMVGRTFAKFSTGGLGFKTSAVMLEKTEELLASSTARFKVVVGHLPIRNFGIHCNYRETEGECAMMSFLEPVLMKYKVDVYFAGHDHNLQAISTEEDEDAYSLLHVISGGGSDVERGSWEKIPKHMKATRDFWMSEVPGFVSVSIEDDALRIDFWDANRGTLVHSLRRQAQRQGGRGSTGLHSLRQQVQR